MGTCTASDDPEAATGFRGAPPRLPICVRTLSGAGTIDVANLTQRVQSNTQIMYHVTDADAASQIAQTGVMLRGSPRCMFGSAIYFAKTKEIAAAKSWHGDLKTGAMVTAEVDLGTCYVPDAADRALSFHKLAALGCDSVWGRAAPHGPMKHADEFAVYNADQVRVISIVQSTPTPGPTHSAGCEPTDSRCIAVLLICILLWYILLRDHNRGCFLSGGCGEHGECDGLVFQTCTCTGLLNNVSHYAGTLCDRVCLNNFTSDGGNGCACSGEYVGEFCELVGCQNDGVPRNGNCFCLPQTYGVQCGKQSEPRQASGHGWALGAAR